MNGNVLYGRFAYGRDLLRTTIMISVISRFSGFPSKGTYMGSMRTKYLLVININVYE